MNLKKIISILIAFMFVLESLVVIAYTDTEATDYEQAVNVLSELDIVNGYEDNTFRPEETLTRAEFAAILARLIGTSFRSPSEEQIFTDVDEEHWAFEYVNMCYAMGYFEGYGDGRFAPDEEISFEQGVKVMVSLLGYKQIAETNGGYPAGYIKVASQKDLLDGFNETGHTGLTRGNASLLIYNSLDAPMLVQTTFGTGDVKYTEDKNTTLLTEYLNLDKFEGVLTATSVTSLYGEALANKGTVTIGGEKFFVGKTDIEAYLGYKLCVYATKSIKKTDDKTVIFFLIADDNEEITVLPDDVDNSTTTEKYVYYEGDKLKTLYLDNYAQVVINGKNEVFYKKTDLVPNSGKVVLINNDNDRHIDVVLVKDYKHYVVKLCDQTELVIYDEYGKAPIELMPSDKEVTYSILRNGSQAKIKNVTQGTVLSVMESRDGGYYELNIVQSVVRGAIQGIEDDKYQIGDNLYEVSTDLPNLESDKLQIGISGTFYLDIDGRIIKFDAEKGGIGYGYLMNAGITNQGLNPIMYFRILTSKNEFEDVPVSKKVKFVKSDGTSVSYDNILTELGGEGTITKQAIKYGKNSEGEVNNVILPVMNFAKLERSFRRGGIFGWGQTDAFLIDKNKTIMFQVPTEVDVTDEEYYRVITDADLEVWQGVYSSIGYDVDGLTAKCAVVDISTSVETYTIAGYSCVITGVSTVVDKDGDPCTKLSFMRNKKKQTALVKENAKMYDCYFEEYVDANGNLANRTTQTPITAADLKFGDVVHFNFDAGDNIIALGRVCSIDPSNPEGTFGFYSHGKAASQARSFATPKRVVGNGILLNEAKDVQLSYNAIRGNTNKLVTYESLYDVTKPAGGMYVVNLKSKTVKLASTADIIDTETSPAEAPYIYMRAPSGSVADVIIIYPNR